MQSHKQVYALLSGEIDSTLTEQDRLNETFQEDIFAIVDDTGLDMDKAIRSVLATSAGKANRERAKELGTISEMLMDAADLFASCEDCDIERAFQAEQEALA